MSKKITKKFVKNKISNKVKKPLVLQELPTKDIIKKIEGEGVFEEEEPRGSGGIPLNDIIVERIRNMEECVEYIVCNAPYSVVISSSNLPKTYTPFVFGWRGQYVLTKKGNYSSYEFKKSKLINFLLKVRKLVLRY